MPENRIPFPRLAVAAPQGRSGKTTVTLGLCLAFKKQGLTVQPFKKGPDYIDPSWLSEASGNPCPSLDPFFYERHEDLLQAFTRDAQGADLSVIEGNHGLFDSFDETGVGSTAALARTLDAPVLLVVNTARTGRSIAAIVNGCQTFEPGTRLAGVVLNRVAHVRHEDRLRKAIENHCQLRVVGAIPRDEKLVIPDRHLGLIPVKEGDSSAHATLAACQQVVEKHLDLEAIVDIARSAPALRKPIPASETDRSAHHSPVRIGVLRDRSFSFYYPENLEALENAGAELIFIDSMQDTLLPEVDALFIGGGFPEMFMAELSANVLLRRAINQAVKEDLPVYAECGGLMYLSRCIRWGDKSAEMVGALPYEVEMTDRPQGHGYVTAQVEIENPFFTPGTILRGHEFHNSRIVSIPDNNGRGGPPTAYHLSRGRGLGEGRDGILYRNVLASYTHLHIGGAPELANGLVASARDYRKTLQQVETG